MSFSNPIPIASAKTILHFIYSYEQSVRQSFISLPFLLLIQGLPFLFTMPMLSTSHSLSRASWASLFNNIKSSQEPSSFPLITKCRPLDSIKPTHRHPLWRTSQEWCDGDNKDRDGVDDDVAGEWRWKEGWQQKRKWKMVDEEGKDFSFFFWRIIGTLSNPEKKREERHTH